MKINWLQHIWNILDMIFGFVVIIAVILVISVIFFPKDNLLLQFGKWLAHAI